MVGGEEKCWGRCRKVCWGVGRDVGKCWGRSGKVCWDVEGGKER